MQEIPLDKLFEKTGSIYKLVTLGFRRAIELNEGATKLVDAKPDVKVTTLALKEILDGKISYKVKEEK
jgi:DNA-directed RNA polymerase omega subunit